MQKNLVPGIFSRQHTTIVLSSAHYKINQYIMNENASWYPLTYQYDTGSFPSPL